MQTPLQHKTDNNSKKQQPLQQEKYGKKNMARKNMARKNMATRKNMETAAFIFSHGVEMLKKGKSRSVIAEVASMSLSRTIVVYDEYGVRLDPLIAL